MSAKARRHDESGTAESGRSHPASRHGGPLRRSLTATCIWAVYLGLFSLAWTFLGVRKKLMAADHPVRLSIDETLRGDADPEATADFTAVGAQMPTVIGLVVALPALLLYPLYEVPAVLTAVLPFMMTCTALSLTQAVRHMAAVRDRSRWQAAGRPPDWRSSVLARPSGIDIIAWLALAALLIWGTS